MLLNSVPTGTSLMHILNIPEELLKIRKDLKKELNMLYGEDHS